MKRIVDVSDGFTLIEVMFSVVVLAVGVLGLSSVMSAGMQNLGSAPYDVIVTQKAAEAIEAVYAARDSHKLAWNQIRNVNGGSGSDGGVFVDGPQQLRMAGPDGLVNTTDDLSTIETITLPGKDQIFGTSDDEKVVLGGITREVIIRDVASESGQLRTVTVNIVYQRGTLRRTYTLSTYISAYA